MRQTEHYKLNLLDGADKLSPKPLNENMETVEEALLGLDGKIDDEVVAVMAAMGSGGSTARIAHGGWTGDGNYGSSHKRTLSFDFKPVMVVAMQYDGRFMQVMVRGASSPGGATDTNLEWGEKSVAFWNYSNTTGQLNQSGYKYYYVAIGV